MKKRALLLAGLTLLTLGSALFAEEGRPYLGVSLDPTALPELLNKHLGLEPGQGIRIENVLRDSPADRAALERDDIIIAFQGKQIAGVQEFVEAVRTAGVGTEVALVVIHLGQKKDLQIKLEPLQGAGEWKYPPEPQAVTSWRPGKVFKIGPDGREWIEVPLDKMPEFNLDIERFFKEVYTFRHTTDGEEYTITIEGDPAEEEARVVVRADQKEYSTTVGKLDKLPEEYRQPAKEDIENARRSVKKDMLMRRGFRLPEPPRPEILQKYFEAVPRDLERWSEQKDRAVEKLQEQIEHLKERMQELEKEHKETLDKLLEKLEMRKEKSAEPKEPAPSEPRQGRAI